MKTQQLSHNQETNKITKNTKKTNVKKNSLSFSTQTPIKKGPRTGIQFHIVKKGYIISSFNLQKKYFFIIQ